MKTKPRLGSRTKSDYTGSRSAALVESPFSTPDVLFRPASQDAIPSPQISEWHEGRSESLSRSWLTKSSLLLRRKNTKSNVKSSRISGWLEDTDRIHNGRSVQEVSNRRQSKQFRLQPIGHGMLLNISSRQCVLTEYIETMLKQSISDPYNFQHLTHTKTVQAKALQDVDHNELVTEFSAIRASQAPHPELKGIRAETLHSRKNSSSCSQISSPTSSFESSMASLSLSPVKSRDHAGEFSYSDAQNIRYSQSVESFIRVSPRSFSSPISPISPPPRRSSRTPSTLPTDQLSSGQQSPIVPLFSSFMSHPYIAPESMSPELSGSHGTMELDSSTQSDTCIVGHALTTPDDTACNLKYYQLNPASTGLADVPEEDESPALIRNTGNSVRPSTASSAVRHTKSFPITTSPKHRAEHPAMNSHPLTYTGSNAKSDPTLPQSTHQVEEIPTKRSSRRVSVGQIAMQNSWEEDIDYCYEHAAEADSSFDWDRVSIEDDQVSSATEVIEEIITNAISNEEHVRDEVDSYSSVANESLSSSAQVSRPASYACAFLDYGRLIQSEIDALSPYSLASSVIDLSGINTPSDSQVSPRLINQLARTSQGSMLFNFGSEMDHEDLAYNDAIKDRHHPIYSHQIGTSLHREDSLQSNDLSLSTCTSQESMSLTRSSSINHLHGASSSISSLPELVHSKNNRRGIEFVTDQLACQTNDLNAVNNAVDPSQKISSLRKTMSTSSIMQEDRKPTPATSRASPSPYRRDRSQSDSTKSTSENPSVRSSQTAPSARIRSATTSSRTSYSLFPSVPAR